MISASCHSFHRSEFSRATARIMRSRLLACFAIVFAASPVMAQTTYDWTGNSNNNWDNAGNWGNASGYPDDPMHNARFDDTNFGGGHTTIDLRGGSRDVLNFLMGQSGYLLEFKSSSGGPGLIRLNGNMNFSNGDGGAETGPHDFMTNIEVVNASLWTRGDNHYVDIYGVLSGSGSLTATANASGAGRLHSRWRSANTFNGTLIIDNVYVEIAHASAFQNADVVVNYDNGFRIDQAAVSGQTINIRSLSGTGLFDFKANDCVTTTDSNTTFSGTLQSTGTNSASRNFTKAGTGILTLTGQVTNFGTLYNTGGGEVEILHGGTWQRLETNGGTLDIRGSATVNLANAGPDVFVVTGSAGAFVRDGADVTLTSNATSPLPRVLQTGGVLNVEGAGSTLTAPRMSVGPDGGGTSLLFAEDGGSIDVDLLQIGDTAPDDGSFGEAVATGGGTIYADQISLFPRGTLSVNGGRVFVDQIAVGGSTEAMSLSDGTNGPALNIGAGGGSSTFNNLINDNLGGAGSISKDGAGTLTLGGANTFSGGISVYGGTLLATNTSGSATGTGDVTIMNLVTLGGTGSCAGAVTVQSGGTVSPGMSVGTLTVGNVTFEAGSKLDIEFSVNIQNVTSDKLVVSNTATLGGTLDLSNMSGGNLLEGNTFVFLTAGNLVGAFDDLVPPDSRPWSITYNYGAGEVRVGPCYDDDSDGVCNTADPCPNDNPDDSDADGVCDSNDACPGFDDNMDADSDGVPDACDVCAGGNDIMDTDSDGVADFCDPCPLDNPDDSDSDGVCDSADICPGFDDAVDSDSDGVPDGCDACPGFDDSIDADNDGTPDACDEDCINSPINVTTAGELIDAINCANLNPNISTIFLDADITLTSAHNITQGPNGLPAVATPIVIEGQGHFIERDANALDPFRIFFVNTGGDLTLHNTTLRNGTAHPNADPNSSHGGAIRVSSGTLTMTNCQAMNNEGINSGGVIHATSNSDVTLDGVVMTGNAASQGGGGALIVSSSSLTIRNSIFEGNYSDSRGGAMEINGSSATITNTIISGNKSESAAGVINLASTITLVNCTIAGNDSTNVGGGLFTVVSSSTTLSNCLLWGNSATDGSQFYTEGGGTLNVRFTGLEGGLAAGGGAGTINDNGGNQSFADTDPVFVNPIDAANAPTADGDYHLAANSVAIDLGDNAAATAAGLTTDIDGDDRIIGGVVDLGADEVTTCPGDGDIDADGVCNSVDVCPGFDDNVDSDNDIVPDGCDACPDFDDSIDADSDGIPDACDEDCVNSPIHATTAQELVDAINCANFSPNISTIFLDADISITSAENNVLGGNGLPVVTTPIVIDGQGHVIERANGANIFRLIYVSGGGLTLRDTTWRNGGSAAGGAIRVDAGTLTMIDCRVENSSGHFRAGGVYALNNTDVTLERVIMTGNNVDSGTGGAVQVEGGTLTVRDSVIAGNTALTGSAIYIDGVIQPIVANTIVSGNYAENAGGAIRNNNSTLTLVNCTLVRNRNVFDGGGLYTTNNGASTVINCIVGGNTSDTNSSREIYTDFTSAFNMSFSALQGGFAAVAGPWNDQGGNLSFTNAAPLFVNPIDAANAPTIDGDYHLVPNSIVIDQGDNTEATNAGLTTDIDGDDRIIGVTVDMGADEATCSLDGDDDGDGVCNSVDICPGFDDGMDTDGDGTPDDCDSCPNRRPGDMNGDHAVDLDDVIPLVQVLLDPNYGTPDERCAADTNVDTLANGGDIQFLLEELLAP